MSGNSFVFGHFLQGVMRFDYGPHFFVNFGKTPKIDNSRMRKCKKHYFSEIPIEEN